MIQSKPPNILTEKLSLNEMIEAGISKKSAEYIIGRSNGQKSWMSFDLQARPETLSYLTNKERKILKNLLKDYEERIGNQFERKMVTIK
jgi:hypothetical protein